LSPRKRRKVLTRKERRIAPPVSPRRYLSSKKKEGKRGKKKGKERERFLRQIWRRGGRGGGPVKISRGEGIGALIFGRGGAGPESTSRGNALKFLLSLTGRKRKPGESSLPFQVEQKSCSKEKKKKDSYQSARGKLPELKGRESHRHLYISRSKGRRRLRTFIFLGERKKQIEAIGGGEKKEVRPRFTLLIPFVHPRRLEGKGGGKRPLLSRRSLRQSHGGKGESTDQPQERKRKKREVRVDVFLFFCLPMVRHTSEKGEKKKDHTRLRVTKGKGKSRQESAFCVFPFFFLSPGNNPSPRGGREKREEKGGGQPQTDAVLERGRVKRGSPGVKIYVPSAQKRKRGRGTR